MEMRIGLVGGAAMAGGFAVPILLFAVTRVEFWLDRRAAVGDTAKKMVLGVSHRTLEGDPLERSSQSPTVRGTAESTIAGAVESGGPVLPCTVDVRDLVVRH